MRPLSGEMRRRLARSVPLLRVYRRAAVACQHTDESFGVGLQRVPDAWRVGGAADLRRATEKGVVLRFILACRRGG